MSQNRPDVPFHHFEALESWPGRAMVSRTGGSDGEDELAAEPDGSLVKAFPPNPDRALKGLHPGADVQPPSTYWTGSDHHSAIVATTESWGMSIACRLWDWVLPAGRCARPLGFPSVARPSSRYT